MQVIRDLSPGRRRLLLIAALVALFVRALVPDGWMPAMAGGHATLTICDGTAHSMAAMPGMRHGSDDAPADHRQGDHPCAFAGPAAAPDVPQVALPLPPEAPVAIMAAMALSIAPGRGLAAPPPPATGPPHLG